VYASQNTARKELQRSKHVKWFIRLRLVCFVKFCSVLLFLVRFRYVTSLVNRHLEIEAGFLLVLRRRCLARGKGDPAGEFHWCRTRPRAKSTSAEAEGKAGKSPGSAAVVLSRFGYVRFGNYIS
jgi:hypothetical protein